MLICLTFLSFKFLVQVVRVVRLIRKGRTVNAWVISNQPNTVCRSSPVTSVSVWLLGQSCKRGPDRPSRKPTNLPVDTTILLICDNHNERWDNGHNIDKNKLSDLNNMSRHTISGDVWERCRLLINITKVNQVLKMVKREGEAWADGVSIKQESDDNGGWRRIGLLCK